MRQILHRSFALYLDRALAGNVHKPEEQLKKRPPVTGGQLCT